MPCGSCQRALKGMGGGLGVKPSENKQFMRVKRYVKPNGTTRYMFLPYRIQGAATMRSFKRMF